MFKMASGGLERWFVVKSTCWYCRGLGFSSQYAHGHLKPSVTTLPGALTPHSDFHGHQAHIRRTNTDIHKIKSFGLCIHMEAHAEERWDALWDALCGISASPQQGPLWLDHYCAGPEEEGSSLADSGPACMGPLQHSHGKGAGGLGGPDEQAIWCPCLQKETAASNSIIFLIQKMKCRKTHN